MLKRRKKKLPRKLKRKIFLKTKPNVFSRSYWMTKFTNKFMQRGRKASVEKIAFRVFTKIRKKYHKDALKILFFSLIKTRPLLGFVTIRLSREMKQIPFPLSPRRQLIISLTWFTLAVKILRYRSKNISIENMLYTQLKAVLHREKTILTKRRLDHIKELLQNRINLQFIRKLKK